MTSKAFSRVSHVSFSISFLVLALLISTAQVRSVAQDTTCAPSAGSVCPTQTSPRPLFLPPVTYGENGAPFAVADVNGDGKLDVVANASVLLGKGDGTFEPPITASGLVGAYSLAVADVNGDGKPDVIEGEKNIASLNYNSGVSVQLGNGDGTFQSPMSFPVDGSLPVSVAVGDLNGDGKPDIVEVSYFGKYGSSISVLLGNGDGTFQPEVTYNPESASVAWVVIADVNGDGKPDLVIANTCGMEYACYPVSEGSVSVLLGNGDGTFQPAVVYDSGGGGLTLLPSANMDALAVGDVNGDGKPDIAVVNAGSDLVDVLLGNGDGTFQAAVGYATNGTGPDSVTIEDVNGDGKADLVVVNECSGAFVGVFCPGEAMMAVLLGNGDGTFQPATTYPVPGPSGTSGDGIVVAALASRHRLKDAVTATNSINVLINDTGAPAPTTTLTSSPDPSVFWQPVTFTATVTSSVTLPTGTVNFLEGSSQIGSGTLTNGVATFTIPFAVGSESIKAVYPGSGSLYGSRSRPLTQRVNASTSTTSVSSSVNPTARGKFVTLTAQVVSQYGGAVSGSVTFTLGSQTLGSASLSSGSASIAVPFSSDGAYSIVATYSGDANNLGSTSMPLTLYVDSDASKITATTSGSPTMAGQPVTFTATVTSRYGTIPNGEFVTFTEGPTILASAALSGGVASFTTSSLSGKAHVIKATYPGDSTFLPSCVWVTQVVDLYSTTTALSSSLDPSTQHAAVTFTATVTSTGPETPTGNVRFKSGTAMLGKVPLSGGVATLTTSNMALGDHSITALYLGDSESAASTSPVVIQQVYFPNTTP